VTKRAPRVRATAARATDVRAQRFLVIAAGLAVATACSHPAVAEEIVEQRLEVEQQRTVVETVPAQPAPPPVVIEKRVEAAPAAPQVVVEKQEEVVEEDD
jgi:ABC-type thiamine transport system substrate-binding protein